MKVSDFSQNGIGADHAQSFGIEIEAEGGVLSRMTRLGPYWHTTQDGSLRNNGIELVSSPLSWDNVVKAVPIAYSALKRAGYTGSVRTGIHVHVNMLGAEVENVGGVLATYCILEPLLFRMCGPEREECIYCVPWYRAPDEIEYAANLLNGNWRDVVRSCKYSALYLEPLVRYGTLEFRHAPTFDEPSKLLVWTSLIKRLVDYGQARTTEDVLKDYHEVGVDQFAISVWGDLTVRVRQNCEKDFVEIVDEVDSVAQAEALVPCTYKVNWSAVALAVEGTGHSGYHALSRINRNSPEMRELPEPDYDEEPDEDYYDEEDRF